MGAGDGLPTVVLASGGARGITARCVVALARQYGWRFILLGRTPIEDPLPAWVDAEMSEAEIKRSIAVEFTTDPQREGTPVRPGEIQQRYEQLRAQLEVETTLRSIAAAGGYAEYVRLDISDGMLREHLAPAIARHGGVVTGIIHGAGALADRALQQKRPADFDRVFSPKARGLRALLDAVELEELRFAVLFSSAAGYYGHAGQADYSLANEVLNKAAHRLHARLPRCRVVAFDWGPWDGGAGMVTPALRRHFEARGIGLLSPDTGTGIVAAALAPDAAPPPQILVGSPLPSPPTYLDGPARVHRIVRRLSEASNPFLRDHVIGGRPVLPVTCAMAWMAHACEGRFPGFRTVRLEECRVLSGVVLDKDEEAELTLDLTEASHSAEGSELRLRAEISRRGAGVRPHPHYRAEVVLAHEHQMAAGDARPPDQAGTPQEEPEGATLYRDGTLFHGPAFRGVQRLLSFDARGLVLECRLPSLDKRLQGQFRTGTVNPYVADALFQGVVVWARRTYGAASLPVCTAAAELHHPLEFDRSYTVSVVIRESGPHRLVADITAEDASRRDVCLRLLGAEVTLSTTLARHFVPAEISTTGAA